MTGVFQNTTNNCPFSSFKLDADIFHYESTTPLTNSGTQYGAVTMDRNCPEIAIVDLHNNSIAKILRGHRGFIHHVCLSRNNQWVASCGSDRTVRIWCLESGEEIHRFAFPEDEPSWDKGLVEFSDDCSMIALGFGNSIEVWSVNDSLQPITTISNPEFGRPCSIAFHPDNTQFAVGYCRLRIAVYSMDSHLTNLISIDWDCIYADPSIISFSPSGDMIASASNGPRNGCYTFYGRLTWTRDGRAVTLLGPRAPICIWDPKSRNRVHKFDYKSPHNHKRACFESKHFHSRSLVVDNTEFTTTNLPGLLGRTLLIHYLQLPYSMALSFIKSFF